MLRSILALSILACAAHATVITVPNNSFELELGAGPFGVNTHFDSWQKPATPVGFTDEQWDQTSGVFFGLIGAQNGQKDNLDQFQAMFLINMTGVGIFQDYGSKDWNDANPSNAFNAIYEPGKVYKLTLGLEGGKGGMSLGSKYEISLYYRDALNNPVTVKRTEIEYQTGVFAPNHLTDFTAETPEVSAGDAWAGKNIGIQIKVTNGDGTGYWDADNVRLESIPEPATAGLLAVGALVLARRRRA